MSHPKSTALGGAIRIATVSALLALGLSGCASTPQPGPGPEVGQTKADNDLTEYEKDTRSRAHYDLAVDHLAKGRTAQALREFLAAVEYRPDDPWIHLGLGECYRRKSLYDEAEQHLLKAIELKPQFQTAELNLSALYTHMKRYEDSAVWAQKLIDDPTYPAPWRAYNNLGWAYYRSGKIAEARKALGTALEYDATFWPAHLNLGILESEAGNKLEAIHHFEEVVKQKPGPFAEAEARYRMGEQFVSLGNRDRALEQFTTVAESPVGSSSWGKKSQDYLKMLQ
jgi:type IV pilus assembly protein PilF